MLAASLEGRKEDMPILLLLHRPTGPEGRMPMVTGAYPV